MILAKNILVATIVNTCTKLLIGGKKTHSNKNMGKMLFFFSMESKIVIFIHGKIRIYLVTVFPSYFLFSKRIFYFWN